MKMASSKEYLEFVLEQLSDLNGISYRAMMGEYVIYYQGKVIGGSSAIAGISLFSKSLLSTSTRIISFAP